MQLNTSDPTGGGIEQLARDILSELVVIAFLLPTAHKIVLLLCNHTIQLWNLVWRILQVGIHSDHYIALRRIKTAVQSRRFAIIATKTDTMNMLILLAELLNHLPRSVGRTIIDEDNLITEIILAHNAHDPLVKNRQTLCLVEQRNDY